MNMLSSPKPLMFELEDLHPHQVLLDVALSLLHWTWCFAGSAGGAVPHVTLLGPGQVPVLPAAKIFL